MASSTAKPGGGPLLPEVAEFGQKHGLSAVAQEELQGLMNASITLSKKRVTVSVPATVANLGPGLETCGLAVDIWDEFTLEYAQAFSLEIFGDNAAEVPRTADQNLVVAGAASAFEFFERPFPALRISCSHRIPFRGGLGAPSASFVGGFLAGSVLCSEEISTLPDSGPGRLPRANSSLADVLGQNTPKRSGGASTEVQTGLDKMLQAAVARGWNPGNVCPAIYGALQIGISTPDGLRSHRVPVPNGLVCVLFVPDNQPEGTALPEQPVDRKAAIFNVGRTALMINCFCTSQFEMFDKAVEDILAQPHCETRYPYLRPVIQAAMDAGAHGAMPCGYGPSVMALITGRTGDVLAQSSSNELERGVAKAMLSKADEVGARGHILIAKPADVGAHVVADKSELGAIEGSGRIVYFQ